MGYKYSQYNFEVKSNKGKNLIFNTKNNALLWLDKSIWRDISKCSETELDKLYNMGIVVDENRDEYEEFCFSKDAFIYNLSPEQIGFVITPTLSCNMRCRYCFENAVENKDVMDKETANRVIDFIKQQVSKNKNLKSLHIRWFGGEPTIAIEIVEHISQALIQYCDDNNIVYNSMIVSNGLLVNRSMAQRLKKLQVKRIQITLDGMATSYAKTKGVSEDCFYTVINNICNINDLIDVIIRINTTANNVDELNELSEYLLIHQNLNGKVRLYFELVRNFSHNTEKNELSPCEFEKRRKKLINSLIKKNCKESVLHQLPQKVFLSCGAMQSQSATIGPNGELYRCDNCLGKNDYIIGDCSTGFWRNKADALFLKADYLEKCSKCSILPVCGGGCLEDRMIEKNVKECDAIKIRLRFDIDVYMRYKERR